METNPTTPVTVEKKAIDWKIYVPVILFLLSIIWYFVYDYGQLKIENVQITTTAIDSIFDVNEDIRFNINFKTNGKTGKIKFFLFDAERGNPSKKIFEDFVNVIDDSTNYYIKTRTSNFDGGYHRICLQYTLETKGFYKYLDNVLVGLKLSSATHEVEEKTGECLFSCIPSEWGNKYGNEYEYSLYIGPRTLRNKNKGEINNQSTDLFYIMKYEVSTQHYEEWANSKAINIYKSDIITTIVDDHNIDVPTYPALMVSWEDAEKYCESLNGRLPTIAEWDLLKETANHPINSQEQIINLEELKEDAYKLFGLNSNAVEWSYDSCLKNKNLKKTYGWGSFNSILYKIDCFQADLQYNNVGFRCVIPRDSMSNILKKFLNEKQAN